MENVLSINSASYDDKLVVMPNYDCQDGGWGNSIGKDEPFFIEITESGLSGIQEEACIGLSLKDATSLRDFLTEKISYLSQK